MNNVLAMTVQQIMAPCRVYMEDFNGECPPDKKLLKRPDGSTRRVPRTSPKDPDIAARIAAAELGDPIYTSFRPCKSCGGTQRYTRNKRCVPCTRENRRCRERERYVSSSGEPGPVRAAMRLASEESRQAAIAQGVNTYLRTWPCQTCGAFLFYTLGKSCVACVKKGSAARKRRERERKKAKRRE